MPITNSSEAYSPASDSRVLGGLHAFQSQGVCTNVDNFTANFHGTYRKVTYFYCSPNGSVPQNWNADLRALIPWLAVTRSGDPNNSSSDPSSNMNYVMGWTSGSCNYAYTDTVTDENSAFTPNTGYWSIQDNAYGSTFCGNTLNYQAVAEIGTASNGYKNDFYVGYLTWPYCFGRSGNYNRYPVLVGTNLNSGMSFETYFTLSSSGYATQAYLTVYTPSGLYMYNAPIPSGNPNVPINGWEAVTVCSGLNGAGCTTNFGGGTGQYSYYQNNIKVSPVNSAYTTGEMSNCNYAGVTIYQNAVYQGFSC